MSGMTAQLADEIYKAACDQAETAAVDQWQSAVPAKVTEMVGGMPVVKKAIEAGAMQGARAMWVELARRGMIKEPS